MKFPRWELRHTADPLDARAYKGSGGGSTNSSATTTQNTDRRQALQDAVSIGDGGSGSFSSSSSTTSYDFSQRADAQVMQTLAQSVPDAARAIASMGQQTVASMGDAIVNLNRDSMASNRQSFDAVVNAGAAMVDKLIDASVKTTETGNALATAAVQSFTPTDNKMADSQKYALIAAAVVVAGVVLTRGGK